MPREHPAVRLAKAEAALKRLVTRGKRIETAIRKRRRSIAALRRSVEKAGPAPDPAPRAPPPKRVKRLDDPILAELQAWGDRAAAVLGVKKPTVRWAGMKNACPRVARAHIHTENGWKWRNGRRERVRRGDVCIARGYTGVRHAADLMAHEVAHLGGRGKRARHGHGNSHGAKFRATMKRIARGLGLVEGESPCPEEAAVAAAGRFLDGGQT